MSAWFGLGSFEIARIVESEEPFQMPTDMFAEATSENLAPYMEWLTPDVICPETGKHKIVVQSYVVRTGRSTILIDACVGNDKSDRWHPPWYRRTQRCQSGHHEPLCSVAPSSQACGSAGLRVLVQ